MNYITSDLKASCGIGLLLLLPLMTLEFINVKNTAKSSLFVLYVLIWLLSIACIFLVMPLLRDARACRNILAQPAGLILRIASVLLIAVMWASVVNDQLPCFLGLPDCD